MASVELVGAGVSVPAPIAGLPAPGSWVSIPGPPFPASAPRSGFAVEDDPVTVPELESVVEDWPTCR